jgi:putative transposase
MKRGSSPMTRRTHTPELLIRKLREVDRMLGERSDVEVVCRHIEVSEATYLHWSLSQP